MIKPTKNIADIKQMVKDCSYKHVAVRVNLGRNKILSYSGVLSGIYPALFTVKPTTMIFWARRRTLIPTCSAAASKSNRYSNSENCDEKRRKRNAAINGRERWEFNRRKIITSKRKQSARKEIVKTCRPKKNDSERGICSGPSGFPTDFLHAFFSFDKKPKNLRGFFSRESHKSDLRHIK